ncbi:MAG: alpha-ketoacid dehydrogenase subunit alpha/beta [Candidatus Dormibacteria bacterium]
MSRTPARGAKGSSLVLPNSRVELSPESVVDDYRVAFRSRQASLVGRREVLSGKAKFGIFGDGKELPQLAMARVFREGDWRAGYYRDQTFALASGIATEQQLFAQLYGDTAPGGDPASGGRQMTNHFATRFIDGDGRPLASLETKNSSADVSCVAGWMPRLLGLAYASKLYRANTELMLAAPGQSMRGDEVAFGTIGDASTSEGLFFETFNAASVLQVPLLMSVWDDGHGISVPIALQTTKASISTALSGFAADATPGWRMYTVPGWDYPALCDAYFMAIDEVRREHVPALLHVTELTQPQGHSTSGSHERYKSAERLAWERQHDGIVRMRDWMLAADLASIAQLEEWEAEDRARVEHQRQLAWEHYQEPISNDGDRLKELIEALSAEMPAESADNILFQLSTTVPLSKRLVEASARRALLALRGAESAGKDELRAFVEEFHARNRNRYRSHLYSTSEASPLAVRPLAASYSPESPRVDGRVVLQQCFEENFARDPRIFVAGEDVGQLGDVNLVFEGLQDRFGKLRVTDTGIREATILGQAVGSAMRGLRPIADIQYIDYFLYALETASDDLATLRWRSDGGQQAPVVIRTKGHRLEGVWHSGSPMSVILNACRGMYLAVPRDMTQAAGMYNTLLRGDDPAMVVEVLNGYRLKERLPDNVGEFTVPLGVPEVLRAGDDLTVVTYGACCRVALDAAEDLASAGVSVEVIDVQTLNPFDVGHDIVRSMRKTNAVLFLDEDVPGGATAYMMREVLEVQNGWWHLDSAPRTLTAADNRCAYASDGDYYCKPNRDEVFRVAYELVRERRPQELAPI